MEKVVEREKVEKAGVEEKRRRRVLGHTAEEKCQAVLTLWTERRKPGEVCREMGVAWGILKQWCWIAHYFNEIFLIKLSRISFFRIILRGEGGPESHPFDYFFLNLGLK